MAFDGLVTAGITAEMRDKIAGSRIDKIYQPEADELLMHIKKHRLFITVNSSHPHVSFKTDYKGNPESPPNFCMLLRKHIQGGIIRDIKQYKSERIIEIIIDTINELGFSKTKKLSIEIMGKHSNVILTDTSDNTIIDSIKRITLDISRERQILPGLTYKYPPSQNKISLFDLTPDHAVTDPAKEIQGVSPSFSDGIMLCCKENDKEPAVYLIEIAERIIKNDYFPCVYFEDNKLDGKTIKTLLDFHVFPMLRYEGLAEKINFDFPSEAVEYYFTNRESSNRIKQKSRDIKKTLENKLDKLYLKKQRLSEDLMKAEEADRYRMFGELITANLYRIQDGADKIKVPNYYDGNDGKEIEVVMDPLRTPPQNAQDYFKKYNKFKKAKTEKKKQLYENEKEIGYLESVISFIDTAETTDELDRIKYELISSGMIRQRRKSDKDKKSNRPAPREFTVDGYRVLVGKNNLENDFITFKKAAKEDVWFHTKDIPGSHVVLIRGNSKGSKDDSGKNNVPSDSTLHKVAEIAAYFSKGRESQSVPVDYCEIKYVKKLPGAKPGMVIFKNNNTIYADPANVSLSSL